MEEVITVEIDFMWMLLWKLLRECELVLAEARLLGMLGWNGKGLLR